MEPPINQRCIHWCQGPNKRDGHFWWLPWGHFHTWSLWTDLWTHIRGQPRNFPGYVSYWDSMYWCTTPLGFCLLLIYLWRNCREHFATIAQRITDIDGKEVDTMLSFVILGVRKAQRLERIATKKNSTVLLRLTVYLWTLKLVKQELEDSGVSIFFVAPNKWGTELTRNGDQHWGALLPFPCQMKWKTLPVDWVLLDFRIYSLPTISYPTNVYPCPHVYQGWLIRISGFHHLYQVVLCEGYTEVEIYNRVLVVISKFPLLV